MYKFKFIIVVSIIVIIIVIIKPLIIAARSFIKKFRLSYKQSYSLKIEFYLKGVAYKQLALY